MRTYQSNDDLRCVVGGPIAVVGALQERVAAETKRADENFASYERVKKKLSAAERVIAAARIESGRHDQEGEGGRPKCELCTAIAEHDAGR